jgi:alanine transaminase
MGVGCTGSGFGQVDGTWHFRTTILPPESAMDAVVKKLKVFHAKFLAEYSE